MLVRNYDYSPSLFEGNLLFTSWHRPVIAMIDCLWGVLDGINDAGLVVSLTFGGRKVVGDGFGIPLILRYILEFCETTKQATEALRRIPAHMTYNVTVLDNAGQFATVYLAPNEPVVITNAAMVTNHQQQIEWPDYARLTSTVERKEFLEERLADSKETAQRFIQRFLHSPLYNTQYEKAFGTLYTAAYYPHRLTAEFYWPHRSPLRQSFTSFNEQKTAVNLRLTRAWFK
jgi:predicted choloylglycine hydrolase